MNFGQTYWHTRGRVPGSMQMTTNFHLRFQNSKKSVIGGVMGVYTKNLGCSPTSALVSLEFIMVQM